MNQVHTPGPYNFRLYATADDPAELRKLGMTPVRMLTNEGQIAIMAPDADQGTKRVALIDCQTKFRRGEGYRTECAERDANARLFSAAAEMLAALKGLIVAATAPATADEDWEAEIAAAEAAIAKAEAR